MKKIILITIILHSFILSIESKYSTVNYQNSISTNHDEFNMINSNKYDSSILSESINPNEYIVGPGDLFHFNMVTSNRVVNIELLVSPTGHILIPIIGKVDILKKTLSQVYILITQKCKEKYEDAHIHINLIKVRNFKVLVKGDFSYSGMHNVSSASKVTDVIENITSLNDMLLTDSLGTFGLNIIPRNVYVNKDVTLVRDNILYPIDLFNFYLNSSEIFNPYLLEGDEIIFQNSSDISIIGNLKKPVRIKYSNKTSYNDLFKNLGIETSFSSLKVINLNMLLSNSNIEVNRVLNTLPDYRSDFDDSFLTARIRSKKGYIFLNNLNQLNEFLKSDISPGEIIIIPEKLDYIEVIGAVFNPGAYKYKANQKISSYLNEAGGYSSSAKNEKIFLVNEITGSKKLIDPNYVPSRGDIIFIEEKLGFRNWQRFTEKIKLAGTISSILASIINIMWIIDRSN